MKNLTAILMGVYILFHASLCNAEWVVIVSKTNPTEAMTQADVEKIFLGKLKLFPDGSSAIPLDMPDKSAEKITFYEQAVGKTESQLRAYWSRVIFTGSGAPPKAVASSADMLKLVAENPNTIGYVDKALINETVRVVWATP